MARAHEIAIAADAKAFDQGIRNDVVKPLEKAEEALADLADAAEDAGRDGARGLDRLEDSLKDAQRQAKKTEDAVDDIGEGGKRGFGKMSESAQEVSQEIGQNLGEAVSSARGNIAELGQVGQDTLGGLAATLAGAGPIGIVGAAGLAAGAFGLGAVTGELQKQQEEADRMRERIGDAYKGAAAEGRRYLDTAALISEASDLMFNPDRADEYKRVLADAKQLDIDRNVVIRANAGDLDAQRIVQERINELLADQDSLVAAGTSGQKGLSAEVADLRDRWAEVSEATQDSASKADDLRAITSDMLIGLIDSAGTAQEEVDELGNKLVTFQGEHGEEKVFIDMQTGEATRNLDRFKGDANGVIDTVNAKEVVLKARATYDQAQRDLDGFVIRNSGKEIKIKSRIVTSGWDE